jgi:hypothetical protein
MYPGLDFDREELAAVMRQTYDELIAFVTTPAFVALHDHMMALDPKDRPGFVTSVVMNRDELSKWDIVVPDGILIQTSAFGDRRPTLFAVKKFLPRKYHVVWENLNWTFDNDREKLNVPRSLDKAWRPPLPVVLQNRLMANGEDLQAVPAEYGVSPDRFAPSQPVGFIESGG